MASKFLCTAVLVSFLACHSAGAIVLPVLCETYGCNVLNAVVMDKDSVFFDGAPDEFRAHGIEDNFWLNDTEVGEGADLVAMSRRRDSSDGYDDEHDSSGDGGRSSGKCGDIGGRKPKVSNRHGKEVTREMKRNAEEMMKKARRYCEDVRVLIVGDSIMRQLNDEPGCMNEIAKDYKKKGLSVGISGAGSRFNKAIVDWMFDKTCLAPQVVFMAVGVNDCIRQESAKDAAQHIIDTVKIIKDYSPDTQVIVQRVLPTSYPIKKFEGTDWEDQKLHDCAKTINEEVEDWIDDNKQHCISQVDMSSVVLDNGEFKDHVYEDGLHFGEDGDMKLYCRAIRKAISDYDNTRVSARGTALDWEDVEPFFYEGLENDNEYYRWAYNEWSSCPMGCGTQRRTAECHLMQVNGTDRVVPDSYCVDSFMNPLERMCNMTDSCLANIQGPRGALIKEPNTLLLSNLQSGNLLLEPNECPKLNTTSKVLLACCALLIGALAFAIVCMIMVLRSIKPSAEEYGHAEKGAEETLNKGGCKQKVQVMVSSSSDGAICDVQSGTSLQP